MKLYTESEVRKAIELSRDTHPEGRAYMERDEYDYSMDEVIDLLTPIELPNNEEIWRWWQTQKFQKEQGEQEYTMLYEIDLPKILKAFIENINKIQGGNNEQQ